MTIALWFAAVIYIGLGISRASFDSGAQLIAQRVVGVAFLVEALQFIYLLCTDGELPLSLWFVISNTGVAIGAIILGVDRIATAIERNTDNTNVDRSPAGGGGLRAGFMPASKPPASNDIDL